MQEQKLNSEQKDETQLPSSPNNAKPNVVRSPNIMSTEKDAETGYTIINQSTNQTINLDGQLIAYLGNRHIHMSGKELIDLLFEKSNKAYPKVGVRQQFGTLKLDENGQGEMKLTWGVMTEDGIILD